MSDEVDILPGYTFTPSPNLSSRGGRPAEVIVFHYTAGGSGHGTTRWLCNPVSRRSAHFVISRTGLVWQLVPLSKKAWHAGYSEAIMPSTGEMESNANRFTIGVEFANHGLLEHHSDGYFYYYIGSSRYLYRRDAQPTRAKLVYDVGYSIFGYWEPYRTAQIVAAARLIEDIENACCRRLQIVGHEDIAMPMGRKSDPGPLFPWDQFNRRNSISRTHSHVSDIPVSS